MANLRVYTFKAPVELKEALRQVVFNKNLESDSEFIRKKIMGDPAIKEVLKTLKQNDTRKIQKV